MTESVDVIVVGAGLSGLSAGLYLQRKNKDVLILEKRSTTLGHLAALPTLIRSDDAVVFDMQVHHTATSRRSPS
jgi:cation diffusion facilitator CzcD-associated flavoprotein CzcO